MAPHDRATLKVDDTALDVEAWFVTPEIATDWLSCNKRNRNPSDRDIINISRSIERGEWRVTGETVVFDSDGVLVDGQHRLKAIAHSGHSVWLIVVRGVEPLAAQDATGQVRKRTLNSQLQVRGEKNASNLAAAVNYLWKLQELGSLSGDNPSISQGLAYLDAHQAIRDHLRARAPLHQSAVRFSGSLAAALSYVFSDVDEDDNAAFWERLSTGAGLESNSPIMQLRDRLIANSQVNSKVHHKLSMEQQAALCIKSWNLWRAGKTCKQLMWKPGGYRPEPFPSWNAEAA